MTPSLQRKLQAAARAASPIVYAAALAAAAVAPVTLSPLAATAPVGGA